MRSRTPILLIILIIGIAAAFLVMLPSDRTDRAAVGSAARDLQLVDINGSRISLSDMKGSVVFINFWATWCESCIEEMPAIERLSRLFSASGKFRVVTILFKDNLPRASGYLTQNGYTFPVYANPDESAARYFGITGIPETFILDKKGILRDKIIGPASWDSPPYLQAIQSLINET